MLWLTLVDVCALYLSSLLWLLLLLANGDRRSKDREMLLFLLPTQILIPILMLILMLMLVFTMPLLLRLLSLLVSVLKMTELDDGEKKEK